uniref:Putative ovule protein n=1 Tax=Solanum chacoense TaxID=4108 RepID=A0A0V0HUV7_SOLCH
METAEDSFQMVIANCGLWHQSRYLNMDKSSRFSSSILDGENVQGHHKSMWGMAGNIGGRDIHENPFEVGGIENQRRWKGSFGRGKIVDNGLTFLIPIWSELGTIVVAGEEEVLEERIVGQNNPTQVKIIGAALIQRDTYFK